MQETDTQMEENSNTQQEDKISETESSTTQNAIFDARKVLEAAALNKQKNPIVENDENISNEIFDLGNLTLLNFENSSLEDVQQKATELTQKLIGNLLEHHYTFQ
jgi:hypothetical protein